MFRFSRINSFLMSPEAGDGASGGGASGAQGTEQTQTETQTEKTITLTQSQLDAMLAKRGKSATRTVEETRAELARREAEILELRQAIEGANDPAKNTELAKLQREIARRDAEIKAERDRAEAATKRADEMTAREKATKVTETLRAALTKAGAHAPGIDQAARLIAMDGAAEVEDDGSVTLTIGGVPYSGPTIEKAASAWLASNPHFQKSPSGGSGARPSNGASAQVLDVDKVPASSLIAAGLRQSSS